LATDAVAAQLVRHARVHEHEATVIAFVDELGDVAVPVQLETVEGTVVGHLGHAACVPRGARAHPPVGYAFFTRDRSNSSVTRSPRSPPPASSGALKLTPQSLRLMATSPSKPTRRLPHGSLTAPMNSKGIVTGRVMPRIARSPVRR